MELPSFRFLDVSHGNAHQTPFHPGSRSMQRLLAVSELHANLAPVTVWKNSVKVTNKSPKRLRAFGELSTDTFENQ